MSKYLFVILSLVLAIGFAAVSFAGGSATMHLKAGDEVYACNCGEACPCHTMSNNPGACSCGKEMVKATVAAADEGTVKLKAAGWEKERTFKTTGKYACACGPSCPCNTISQNPGTCTCGKEMKKVD